MISACGAPSIDLCKTKIREILSQNVEYTHFIGIPLYSKKLEEFYDEFIQDLTNHSTELEIDPSCIYTCQKLHYTLLMLKILSPDDKKRAVKVMNDLIEPEMRKQTFEVSAVKSFNVGQCNQFIMIE